MIKLANIAFEFLRQHKQVTEDTESLVLKRTSGRISSTDLLSCFEKGIAGDYGKVYSLDPQTLLGWVKQWEQGKNSSKSYMESGLLDVMTPSWETIEWEKEANKCLTAFMNGVSETNFHPCVYDRMMIDGKIPINTYLKYFNRKGLEEAEEKRAVMQAKQKVLKDIFQEYKSKGWSQVYFI